MHGISMNSSLEIDLLSLRKYNIRRQQGQGQGQGQCYLLLFQDSEFTKNFEFNKKLKIT